MKYLANSITSIRIVASVLLLPFQPLGVAFMALYTLCGVTDMVDGTIARKLHTDNRTGAVLDSIADIFFMVAAAVKIFPVLFPLAPKGFSYALGGIVFCKVAAYVVGYIRFHCFVALHTILNKITGAMLFVLPYFLVLWNQTWFIKGMINTMIIVAAIAAIEELVCQIVMKQNMPDIKSIYDLRG